MVFLEQSGEEKRGINRLIPHRREYVGSLTSMRSTSARMSAGASARRCKSWSSRPSSCILYRLEACKKAMNARSIAHLQQPGT